MNNQCVFCGTSDNLTVTMQVTTSLGNQTVYICSEHEDQAAPKRVRELAEKRNNMMQEFERQAKELGFKLVPLNGVVAASSTPASPPTASAPTPVSESPKMPVISSKKVAIQKKVRDIDTPSVATDNTGVLGSQDLGKHSSYDTTQPTLAKDGRNVAAPGIIEHEEQIVEGRAGAPVVLPRKVVSEAGVTEINIVNTGGDKALQERFKSIQNASAEARSKNEAERAILSGGYLARECTLCKGTGITKINNQTCKKCGGVGTI